MNLLNFNAHVIQVMTKAHLKRQQKTIFLLYSGNINQGNSIVIRYHGILAENTVSNSTQFNIFYYFDKSENDKKTLKLQKCTKCDGQCYCATIDLDMFHSLHFGFYNENFEYELGKETPFTLDISPDPITDIMQRYGFEQNKNLPTYSATTDEINVFKEIVNKIKSFFNKVLNLKTTNTSHI